MTTVVSIEVEMFITRKYTESMYLSETAKRKAERRKIKAYQKERGLKIDLSDEIEVAKMIKHQTCVGNITSHSS